MTNAAGPVDVLVFGPHPDDIEIGIGGTVAKHARLGHRVGLCDLTAGEMGSNGTVAERLAEAEAARAVLGAAWRTNLRLPDRAIGSSPEHLRAVAGLVRCARPASVALPYWSDRHPDHVRASELLTEAVFSAGLRRFDASGEAWKPGAVFYYFINDHAAPSFVVDERRLRDEAARAGLPRHAIRAGGAGCGGDPAHVEPVSTADREPRRAVRCADPGGLRGRFRHAAAAREARPP